MKKKFVEYGKYWRCENLDLLADIVEEGFEFLLLDNTYELVEDGNDLSNYEKCSEEEYKDFYHKYGNVFIGDELVVYKGRKFPKGTKIKVEGFYRYYVPGTYNHVLTDYVLFDNDKKVDIDNCLLVGYEESTKGNLHKFSKYCVGGRV